MMDAKSVTTATRYQVTVGSRTLSIELLESDHGLAARIDEREPVPVHMIQPRDDGLWAIVVGDRVIAALVDGADDAYTVVLDGEPLQVQVQDERAARLASATAAHRQATAETTVRAPMPGLVIAVPVTPGQAVTKGTSLVVLQAMKMENELTARDDATIKEVLVSPGQTVEQNQTLVTLE